MGIIALFDLAMDEPPAALSREMVYCRFPLVDGGGNPAAIVRGAIESLAALIRAGSPVLAYCSAGMSRSPSIAAAALSLVSGQTPEECLRLVVHGAPADISPGLWSQVLEAHSRITLPAR